MNDMFRKVGGSHAASTDGFEVMFRGRDDLVYIEKRTGDAQRKVTIHTDLLIGGRVNRSIEAGPKWLNHWDPPDASTDISECERQQIIQNITAALDFLGITYDLRA